MGFFLVPHQEIVWLDVSVDELPAMHIFDSLQHLVAKHQNRFEGKFAVAPIEKIFQACPEQVHHHNVVTIIVAAKVDPWYALVLVEVIIVQVLIQLGLEINLWKFCIRLL